MGVDKGPEIYEIGRKSHIPLTAEMSLIFREEPVWIKKASLPANGK